MTSNQSHNQYLDQVVQQQEQLASELRAKRSAPMPAAAPARFAARMDANEAARADATLPNDPGGGGGSNAVEVRVSGFGRWKTVLVPPNAFVVHTRRGHDKPLHVGLGVSFRFNPATDSYLV